MTERLSFIQLDARGLEYVREHLTGVNAFCTALAETILFTPGTVFTLAPQGAPQGVTLERLHRFTEGGLIAANRDGGGLKIEQAAYLLSLLREDPERVCIIDDFEPSWAQAQLTSAPEAFGADDDVYHLFTVESSPEDVLAALVRGDTGWHGVAAVCAQELELDEARIAEVEALQAVAASVIALTCTAYDGEGFVAWARAPQRDA